MAKHSALHHWAAQAGAVFTEHHGWQMPARFSDPGEERALVARAAGLADVSWMAKLDLKGRGVETLAALGDGVRWWALGPGHLLVTCDPGRRENAALQLARATEVLVTDVTSVFAQFLLAGPRSREILAKLTSLNVSEDALPDGGCRQTSLAHVHATVLRQDLGATTASSRSRLGMNASDQFGMNASEPRALASGGLPAFQLLVARDYGESVWEAVLHAGHEFHAAPFGLETLSALAAEA
jgi:heterotetrameric sarcosine oxidase gamma subunit